MEPSRKSPGMESLLEGLFGRTTAIENNRCTMCPEDASVLRDDLSRKEYTISGMCQACQDRVFN